MSLTKVTNSMISGAFLNVLDYGADPTGVADSTTKIQAAIDAAILILGTVFIPVGTYKISSTLLVALPAAPYKGINIVGEGRGSILNWYGGNNTIVIHMKGAASLGPTSMSTIEGLRIINANASTGLVGISVGTSGVAAESVALCTVRKNAIEGMDVFIILCTGSDECWVSENHTIGGTTAGIWIESISSGHMIANNHIQSYDNGFYGIMVKGTAITLNSNVVQSSNYCTAAIVTDGAQGLSIFGLYSESPAGATACILLQSSTGVIIGGCNIQAYSSSTLIRVGATCKDVTILPSHHGTSGGAITNLMVVDAGATGVSVVGGIDTTGTVNTITGNLVMRVRERTTQFPQGISSVGGEYALNETVNFVNVLAGATTTLFTIATGSSYQVYIEQSTESYGAAGVVFAASGSATAILFKTGSTNADLQLAVSGLNVQAYNGTGATRTITFTALRIPI